MRVFVYNSNGYDNTVLSNLYAWPEQPVNAIRKKKAGFYFCATSTA